MNYGGFKNLPESKYRPSSIPNDSLEIPITLITKKGNSTRNVFEKKVKKLYIEPEKTIRSNHGMIVDFEAD